MNGFFPLLLVVLGSYLLICSLFYKDNKIFDFLIQRSKMSKGNVYIFYIVISIILIILGFLYALDIF
jgi:hypothetical protein